MQLLEEFVLFKKAEKPASLANMIPQLNRGGQHAISMITGLLAFDPIQRWTAKDVITHINTNIRH